LNIVDQLCSHISFGRTVCHINNPKAIHTALQLLLNTKPALFYDNIAE